MKKVFSLEKFIKSCDKKGYTLSEIANQVGIWAYDCNGLTPEEMHTEQHCGCIDDWLEEVPENDDEVPDIKKEIKKSKPIEIWQEEIHQNAKDHGWWEEERNFGELIALCHSELSEALEEVRKGKKPNETYYSEGNKPEGVPSELADVIIRILDMCEYYDIDMQSMIYEKHQYNKTRPYKHGKQF